VVWILILKDRIDVKKTNKKMERERVGTEKYTPWIVVDIYALGYMLDKTYILVWIFYI